MEPDTTLSDLPVHASPCVKRSHDGRSFAPMCLAPHLRQSFRPGALTRRTPVRRKSRYLPTILQGLRSDSIRIRTAEFRYTGKTEIYDDTAKSRSIRSPEPEHAQNARFLDAIRSGMSTTICSCSAFFLNEAGAPASAKIAFVIPTNGRICCAPVPRPCHSFRRDGPLRL